MSETTVNPSEQSRRKHSRAYLAAATAALLLASACGKVPGTQENQPSVKPVVDIQKPTASASSDPNSISLTIDPDPKINIIPNPMPNPKGFEQITPQGITLHWWSYSTNGDIEGLRRGLQKNPSCGQKGCSVQYGITEDGKIYQMMDSPTEFAYHASGGNSTTFGIEIEGKPEDFALQGPKFNQKKLEAVVSLTAELVEQYGLQIEGEMQCGSVSGIHGHHEYNECSNPRGSKTDVGDQYTQVVIQSVYAMQSTSQQG
jgi:hypothetical protein